MTIHTLGTNNASIASAPPADDAAGDALYNELVVLSGNSDPFISSLATDLLNELKNTPHVFSQMTAVMDAYLTKDFAKAGEPFCDAYMHYKKGMNEFIIFFYNDIDGVLGPLGYKYNMPSSLHYTNNDNLYYYIAYWMPEPYCPGDVKPLTQAFLDQLAAKLGSNGDPKDIPGLINQMLTDPSFFTNYPQFDPATNPNVVADIQAFVSQVNDLNPSPTQLPDYMLQYLQLGFDWPNPIKNSDDAQLQNDFLAAARASWATGHLSDLTKKAHDVIYGSPAFGDYPDLDIFGAHNLENIFNLPCLTFEEKEARANLAKQVPGSPAAKMWQDFLNAITSLGPAGKPADLENWYDTQFKTTDIYMAYYNVDGNDPQYTNITAEWNLVHLGNALSPTSMDVQYRNAMKYRDTLSPSSDDYTLMNDLGRQLCQFGSNPTADQLDQIDSWAENLVTDPNSDYAKATAATQQVFLANLDYTVTLYSNILYLNQWAGPTSPEYDQQFAETLIGIIQGYMQSQIDPSQLSKADFQNYLDEYYSDIDYSLMFPGLTQTDINSVYAALRLTNPYNPPASGPADTAFASAIQAYGQLPKPTTVGNEAAYNGDGRIASPGLFQELANWRSGSISATDVKKWILWFETTQYWQESVQAGGVSQATKDEFNTILNM